MRSRVEKDACAAVRGQGCPETRYVVLWHVICVRGRRRNVTQDAFRVRKFWRRVCGTLCMCVGVYLFAACSMTCSCVLFGVWCSEKESRKGGDLHAFAHGTGGPDGARAVGASGVGSRSSLGTSSATAGSRSSERRSKTVGALAAASRRALRAAPRVRHAGRPRGGRRGEPPRARAQCFPWCATSDAALGRTRAHRILSLLGAARRISRRKSARGRTHGRRSSRSWTTVSGWRRRMR